VLTATAFLLAYGVAEGIWTDRWTVGAELEQAPARLEALPLTVGPWTGEREQLDARQVQRAELRAHVLTRYTHRGTQDVLTVLVVCGRPGPVAVHSPEICFGGAGFSLTAPPERRTLSVPGLTGKSDFWEGRFELNTGVPEALKVYWSWNAGAGWDAVDDPRWSFAAKRALYKIYVVRQMVRSDEPAEEDPIPGFLELYLPELKRCLFPEA
jgi:hypothetical protein